MSDLHYHGLGLGEELPAGSAADAGVSSAGLSTTVLPHASAGATFHDSSMSGKFPVRDAQAEHLGVVGGRKVKIWGPDIDVSQPEYAHVGTSSLFARPLDADANPQWRSK